MISIRSFMKSVTFFNRY